jgi:hypothetical protein
VLVWIVSQLVGSRQDTLIALTLNSLILTVLYACLRYSNREMKKWEQKEHAQNFLGRTASKMSRGAGVIIHGGSLEVIRHAQRSKTFK